MGLIRANRAIKFSASLGSPQQSFAANVFTKIVYSTENEDSSNAYNPGTGRFVVPVPGNYLFTASFFPAQASAPTRLILSYFKNGVEFQRSCDQTFVTGGNMQIPPAVMQVPLAVGDYIEFFVFPTTAINNFTNTAFNNFSGFLL